MATEGIEKAVSCLEHFLLSGDLLHIGKVALSERLSQVAQLKLYVAVE